MTEYGEYIVSMYCAQSGVKCERIVRCRDCKRYHDGTMNGRRYSEPHCLAIGELSCGGVFEVDENDYCSWAERRDYVE